MNVCEEKLKDYVSVHPLSIKAFSSGAEFKNQGVGHELIKAGFIECKQLGYLACVVLGQPI